MYYLTAFPVYLQSRNTGTKLVVQQQQQHMRKVPPLPVSRYRTGTQIHNLTWPNFVIIPERIDKK